MNTSKRPVAAAISQKETEFMMGKYERMRRLSYMYGLRIADSMECLCPRMDGTTDERLILWIENNSNDSLQFNTHRSVRVNTTVQDGECYY